MGFRGKLGSAHRVKDQRLLKRKTEENPKIYPKSLASKVKKGTGSLSKLLNEDTPQKYNQKVTVFMCTVWLNQSFLSYCFKDVIMLPYHFK